MTDRPEPGPLAPARRAHVLDTLARDRVVRISALTTELGVTPVTLRRDLARMEQEGLLVRVHGGAVPVTGAGLPGSGAWKEPEAGGGQIAVLVPSLQYYWPTVVRGMEAEARRRGLRVLLRGASYELQDERPVLETLIRSTDVRGLIVAPNTNTPHTRDVINWLAESPLPSVLVERDGRRPPGNEPVESATTDHALGAVLAARHLADLGHRRVGLILSRNSPTSRKIESGWLTACRELGLEPSQHFEGTLPDRASADFPTAINTALDRATGSGVTGVLVHSDPEAMALIDLAMTRGVSVPGDLSVIAYDDEVAELFTPALTAVSPPRTAVGAAAVDLLVKRLEDPTRPTHRVVLSPSLRIRESTAPPPDAIPSGQR